MELTLDQALQKGIEAHKAGQVQKADSYYTAILKANPKHPDANHNMGVLAVGVGKVQEALPFFKTALEANPSMAQYWLSCIDALLKLDRKADAKAIFAEAKINGANGDSFDQIEKQLRSSTSKSSNAQEPPQEQLENLINLYTHEQYGQALTHALQLLKKYDNSINLYNIIGSANKELGKPDDAIAAYKKALAIKSDYAEAYYNMGIALKDQGKLEEATAAYNKAVKIKPDCAEAYNNMGVALQDQGKLEEAIEAYNKAMKIKPNYAEAYYNLGNALKEQGKLEEGIVAYNKAMKIKPNYAEAYNNMGVALQEQGKRVDAIAAFNKGLAIKPDYAEAYYNMGVTFQEQGKRVDAIAAFNKGLAIKPDYAEVHRNLSFIKEYKENDKQIKQVQDLYKQEDLSEDQKCNLSFTLVKMYEDIGDIDKSFAFLTKGNSLRKKLLNYSIDQDKNLFSKLKNAQPYLCKTSPDVKAGSIDTIPIFILGMPRTGSTLVEQIISSHSEVFGAGELRYVSQLGLNLSVVPKAINTAAISEFRHRYLLELSKVTNSKSIVTDKMPQNFRFIPLICAAFPEAKIIHVERDATATCWSNYKQYFVSNGLGYCYDLEDVVSYYQLYKDLMKFWQLQYGDRIYNLNYENLTTDQENQTKKLIEHLGLNWEEACLSPHENKRSVRTISQQQIRRKVYQGSNEAWRKYEVLLNGAFDSLLS